MEFIKKCIDYLKENPTLAIVLAAAVAVIVIVIIVLCAVSAKKRKQRKLAHAQETAIAKQKEAEEQTAKRKEAERQATLWRLEAERLTAEREEAEEKAAKEKAEAEKAAQERARLETQAKERAAMEKREAKKAAPAPKKTEPAPVATEKNAKYSGKWTICRVVTDEEESEETYFFELRASNGEKLLSSEEYTSYGGALKGIETHKTNIEKGNFKITLSKKGDYIFKLLSGKNMLLCMGENYPTRIRCESAVESTKRFAKTAVLDENVQDIVIKLPPEDDSTATPVAEGIVGKWVVTSHEDADGGTAYYFELFANNGEKLLSSEEYTTYIGAVNGIQTHKSNIERNNFRISLTKRGDYIYKLLNGNGQLLCLGEHYKTKRLCQSAVESVKRFSANSPVLIDPELKK